MHARTLVLVASATLLAIATPAAAQEDSEGDEGGEGINDLLDAIPEIEAPKSAEMIAQEEAANQPEDVSFPIYTGRVNKQILGAWQPKEKMLRKDPHLAAQLLVQVGDDGSILGVVFVESSGEKKFDKSVLAAINDVGNVEAPPTAFAGDAERGIIVSFSAREALR